MYNANWVSYRGFDAAKRVCYYTGLPGSVYEDLGHAEVVQVDLQGTSGDSEDQMRKFATTYFGQFKKTPRGMQRSDPQDAGPAYRNVVGVPGGVHGPLFKVLEVSCTRALHVWRQRSVGQK